MRVSGIRRPVGIVALKLMVRFIGIRGLPALRNHLVPGRHIPIVSRVVMNSIPIFPVATIIAGGKGIIRPLSGVVQPPVNPVYV